MIRVSGNKEVALVEQTNPVKGLWRVRFDVQIADDESATYMEMQFEHKPTIEEIKYLVIGYYNSEIDRKILCGFEYDGMAVWLSSENQFNYKAAFDLAMQTEGATLPVTFKFGTDEDPTYREFVTLEEFIDFYQKSMSYVQMTLQEGWKKKDSFDWKSYEELLEKE